MGTFITEEPQKYGLPNYRFAVIQESGGRIVSRHPFTSMEAAQQAKADLQMRTPASQTERAINIAKTKVAPKAKGVAIRGAKGGFSFGRRAGIALGHRTYRHFTGVSYEDQRIADLQKQLTIAQKQGQIKKLQDELSRLRA